MKMNLDLKNIPAKLMQLLNWLKKYAVFGFVILVLGAYSFLVFQVRRAINAEPTETQVTEKLQDLRKTRLDKDAISKIEDLQSSNVEVQALFQAARDNPFQE